MNIDSLLNKKEDEMDTQRLILTSAIECVKQWGIERVTLNDIARQAKVARSTVYNYYSSKDEVISAALLESAYGFGIKLTEHIMQFDSPEQRLIEAVVFSLNTLPNEPSLALISNSALSQIVREQSLTKAEGLDMSSAMLKMILDDETVTVEELQEISETCMRFLLSMLMMDSPVERSDAELRGYIGRRLLPALGLTVPQALNKYGKY